jgi:thimet oligopeptidase
MNPEFRPVRSLLCGLALAGAASGAELPTVAQFQARSAGFASVITVPAFETSPEQIAREADETIAAGKAALDRIARQDPAAATFESTFGALDRAASDVTDVTDRLDLEEQSNPSAAMRAAAQAALNRVEQWSVGTDYREDVYRILKLVADRHPPVSGEDARLLKFTLRDYRRAGLALAPAERRRVEALRQELGGLENDFSVNVSQATRSLVFTRAQLAGVPASFLDQPGIRTGADAYTVHVNVTPERLLVEENCSVAATRRSVTDAEFNLAKDVDVPLMNRIIALRAEIARRLGYGSWADYATETSMAKTGAAALAFEREMIRGVEPKYRAELAELNALKARDTHDPRAQVDITDWRYYQNQLVKTKYSVDTEALRVYFPYPRCLEGMFRIYSSIFGIRIEQLQAPYVWANGVTLWGVSDARTGEPLGLFYLDMFPRPGKYNHFANFGIQEGHQLPEGRFERPVVCLLCNFPPPGTGRPPLLSHDEVRTLFHEFGHCLHAILTRARRGRFVGTNVPRDFVEAPSQMLENWVFDKRVLDTFAADYRDPSKKVPAAILARMKEVRMGTAGIFYRRQFALGYLDLVLHGPRPAGAPVDCQAETNRAWDDVFLPVPPGSAFIAYFAHLTSGYDAGYYGYAWADAIAADMATVFESAPGGFLDRAAGRRMRDEIYAQGNARDVSVSVERFLGRPRSLTPFLRRLGVNPAAPAR